MKRIISVLLVALLSLSLTVPLFAADGNVTYDGTSRNFIFAPGGEHSLTDLFPNFKDVMPGDKLSQSITVKNERSNEVKVNIYIRSLGALEGSEEFLSQLNMKVVRSENNTMAYMFDAAADQTAGMTDWVYLGTLYSGGEVNLDVTLDVPTTLGNEFKNQVGYLKWEFMVEELPVEPDDPEPPPTGDESGVVIYASIAVVAIVLMLVLIIVIKRRKDNEENEEF